MSDNLTRNFYAQKLAIETEIVIKRDNQNAKFWHTIFYFETVCIDVIIGRVIDLAGFVMEK